MLCLNSVNDTITFDLNIKQVGGFFMAKYLRYDAIYVRQSIDKKDSVSIEAQIEECKKLCSANFKVYKDKGYSGKNTERPQVQKMIKDIESGIIQKVVVYKLDRISRNIIDFYNLYGIMQLHDCEFISWDEKFDTTTSMGRAMMGILVVFAQMERENIQTRIKDNYNYRIRDGRWASGKAPFGFKNGKRDGKTTLIPVPEEIEVVKWMFKTYAESLNISLGMIQKQLIEKGIKGHQSSKGFSRTTIGHILTNPVYCSADNLLAEYYQKKLIEFVNPLQQWDGSFSAAIVGKKNRSLRNENLEGIVVYITNIKPVINSRTFIAVQERIEQNAAVASNNTPNHNLKELSGLLKCAECGSAVKMQTYPTLTCTGRSQKKICSVSFKGIKLETVQDNVATQVQKYLENLNETQIKKTYKMRQEQKEIAKLEKELEKLMELAKFSDNIAERVKVEIDSLIVKIKEKQLKLKTDRKDDIIGLRLATGGDIEILRSIFDEDGTLVFNYSDLDIERKQMILRVLVDRIYVYKDGSVNIEWKG